MGTRGRHSTEGDGNIESALFRLFIVYLLLMRSDKPLFTETLVAILRHLYPEFHNFAD